MTKIAALEEFIEAFNCYEADFGLFRLRDDDDFPWWDLVRYRVQYAMCVELGIYGRRHLRRIGSINRALSFARQCWQLARDFNKLTNIDRGRIRCLVVSSRALAELAGVIDECALKGYPTLVVSNDTCLAPPHLSVANKSIAFFVRLYAHFCRVPPAVQSDIRYLAGTISKQFESNLDLFPLITAKYREHLAAKVAWSFVLRRAGGLDRIVYVNDDTLKTLVFLARKSGIPTEEIGHGYMGRSHIAFSYPPLPSTLETLPDKIVINRDTGDISYPVKKALLIKHERTALPSPPRDIDVLIGASPTFQDETNSIIGALVGRGLKLAVKLHPAQTVESSQIAERFPSVRFEISDGEENFCDLARRAIIYVPANPTSTTTFEAVENGALLVVVDFGGIRRTVLHDRTARARALSIDDLFMVVESLLREANCDEKKYGSSCHEA